MTKHITKLATRKLRVTASPKTSIAVTTPYAVGIDIGDRLSYICILDSEEAPCREDRVRTSAASFSKYFEELPFSRIALEAGPHSGWVSRLLEALGHTVVVANARELRKIHQSDRKNDRADARVLARMVRFDPQLLAPIRHRKRADASRPGNDSSARYARGCPYEMRKRRARLSQGQRRSTAQMQHASLWYRSV
jgi:hypothetical protein